MIARTITRANTSAFSLLAATALTLFLSASTFAAVTKEQVDAIVQPAIDAGFCKSVEVGIVDASGRQLFSYGITADGGRPPDGKTVYEIGSITKVFTSLLLAEMVQDGTVRLDQPVRELLPKDVKVPSRDGVQITLLDLSDQTSGLPRMPDDLHASDLKNPYANFGPRELDDALGRITLTRKPGEKYEYSNLAVGLLGHALSIKAGTAYEQLVIDRICTPLGIKDTRITLNEQMRARLAPGYVGRRVVPNWDFDALAGAGAIRSTADDLLTLVAAEAGLIDSPLAAAMKLTQERRASVDASTDIAMAWHIGKRTGTRWHNGQTAGYHSFAAFVRDKRVGAVVLSNSADGAVDAMGTSLIKALLGEKVD